MEPVPRDVRSYVFYLPDQKKITFLRYVKKSKIKIHSKARTRYAVVNKNSVIGRNLGPPWVCHTQVCHRTTL